MEAAVKDAAGSGGGRGFLTQEETGPGGAVISDEASRPSRQPRILVLEDEETVQSVVQAMLKITGLRLRHGGHRGGGALAPVRGRATTSSSWTCTCRTARASSWSRQAGAESPMVIVMTGSSNIQTAVQAIRGGAIDFITKPFSVGQFLQRVDNALQEWRSRESLQGHARAPGGARAAEDGGALAHLAADRRGLRHDRGGPGRGAQPEGPRDGRPLRAGVARTA